MFTKAECIPLYVNSSPLFNSAPLTPQPWKNQNVERKKHYSFTREQIWRNVWKICHARKRQGVAWWRILRETKKVSKTQKDTERGRTKDRKEGRSEEKKGKDEKKERKRRKRSVTILGCISRYLLQKVSDYSFMHQSCLHEIRLSPTPAWRLWISK